MTPLKICKSQSKVLRLILSSKKAVFITDAFCDVGIDSYAFSDHFIRINALAQCDIFYQSLVSNMKLFGRYQVPVKCLRASLFDVYANLSEHIVYIDAFKMNLSIKANDCCPDIAYFDKSIHSTSYLSTLCNEIYSKNKGKNLMLIAVKVPKHFIVAEFIQKIESAHIIVFDFAILHQSRQRIFRRKYQKIAANIVIAIQLNFIRTTLNLHSFRLNAMCKQHKFDGEIKQTFIF